MGIQSPFSDLCGVLADLFGSGCHSDVALICDGRVLDNGMSILESGLVESGNNPDLRLSLHFALACEAAVTQSVVRGLAQVWATDLPAHARRPPLSELTHLTTESGTSNGLSAAACTAYGKRVANEDAHTLLCDWAQLPLAAGNTGAGALFAVCDGHGGSLASRHVVERVATELGSQVAEHGWSEPAARRAAVERSFVAMDAWLSQHMASKGCGTTCVVARVWPESQDGKHGYSLLLANLGDSRGLLYRKGLDELSETIDHKPDDPREKRRIRAAGGFVVPAMQPNPARLDGVLSLARAFGDFRFKESPELGPENQKVSTLPDVYELRADSGDVLILACDGVFDVLPSADVAALAVHELEQSGTVGTCGDPVAAAATVCWAALESGTEDNVTCVVVQLGHEG
jgi:serine/threonine protein phosphatase PrpC